MQTSWCRSRIAMQALCNMAPLCLCRCAGLAASKVASHPKVSREELFFSLLLTREVSTRIAASQH